MKKQWRAAGFGRMQNKLKITQRRNSLALDIRVKLVSRFTVYGDYRLFGQCVAPMGQYEPFYHYWPIWGRGGYIRPWAISGLRVFAQKRNKSASVYITVDFFRHLNHKEKQPKREGTGHKGDKKSSLKKRKYFCDILANSQKLWESSQIRWNIQWSMKRKVSIRIISEV